MNALITNALANKHTTGAGVAYAVAKFGLPVLQSWFPGHESAFKTTAESLEGFAVFYGLASAGDAQKSLTKDEAETKFVSKDTKTP